MCNKAVDTSPSVTHLFLNVKRLNKYVIQLLIVVLLYLILFLIDIRLKKCVIKMFPKILLCQNIVLIDIKPKKYVLNLLIFSTNTKFVPDWFVTRKMIKKLDDLKVLLWAYNLIIKRITRTCKKWVFLVYISIISQSPEKKQFGNGVTLFVYVIFLP